MYSKPHNHYPRIGFDGSADRVNPVSPHPAREDLKKTHTHTHTQIEKIKKRNEINNKNYFLCGAVWCDDPECVPDTHQNKGKNV